MRSQRAQSTPGPARHYRDRPCRLRRSVRFPGLWSSKADLRPSRLVLLIDAGSDGSLTLTIDLTNYDAAVTIAAPPADQVSARPFSLPGITP